MKITKSIGLSLVIGIAVTAMAADAPFRTDINPALRYYQAFILAPDLSQADRDYLFNKEWRGQKFPERFGDLIASYNKELTQVRQAAQATVPCDWGIDMTPGPATLLPHLARCKGIAQAARLRAMWHLQHGRQEEAREDLVAALALARNSSRDGTLIAVLVEIAMEHIVCSAVAENFHQFSTENLKELAAGFAATPTRGTVAACMSAERSLSHDWMLGKIRDFQKQHAGDDAKVMAAIDELLVSIEGPGDEQNGQPQMQLREKVDRAAGGTSEGVVKLLIEMESFQQRLSVITALPEGEYEGRMEEFMAETQKSQNPLVIELLPALNKCRPKEFASLVELAMVQAAVEYKLHGEPGLKSVIDPCGQGPFGLQRFVFGGVDRGFELKSTYAGRGFPEVMIFIEKDGTPFVVGGKNAGQALPKSSSRK